MFQVALPPHLVYECTIAQEWVSQTVHITCGRATRIELQRLASSVAKDEKTANGMQQRVLHGSTGACLIAWTSLPLPYSQFQSYKVICLFYCWFVLRSGVCMGSSSNHF